MSEILEQKTVETNNSFREIPVALIQKLFKIRQLC